MNNLSDKQLELNQKFIDLLTKYQWDEEDEGNPVEFDSKDLFKFIWHSGYMLREKDNTIYA